MKTIAEQLNVKEFPLIINDSKGNRIYFEDSEGTIRDYRIIPEYTQQDLINEIRNFKLK